jgi:hypothetical protein
MDQTNTEGQPRSIKKFGFDISTNTQAQPQKNGLGSNVRFQQGRRDKKYN